MQPHPMRGDRIGDRLDRDAGFEDMVQIEIDIARSRRTTRASAAAARACATSSL